jgi:hypothetical protein
LITGWRLQQLRAPNASIKLEDTPGLIKKSDTKFCSSKEAFATKNPAKMLLAFL